MYYLRSRYYDAFLCRFINADVIIECFLPAPRGGNFFSYCNNNCTCYSDANGNVPRLSIQEWQQIREFVLRNELKKAIEQERIVQYDVPVYSQGSYKLCWAFCQVMVEESTSGSPKTQEQAVERAIEIAKSYHRSENMDKWNHSGWPTNLSIWGLGIRMRVSSITDIFDVLKKQGPVYAYYEIKSEKRAHLVVVTGVNLIENQIYTNNPWGVAGGQTFEEFTNGVVGASEDDGWKLRWLIY